MSADFVSGGIQNIYNYSFNMQNWNAAIEALAQLTESFDTRTTTQLNMSSSSSHAETCSGKDLIYLWSSSFLDAGSTMSCHLPASHKRFG